MPASDKWILCLPETRLDGQQLRAQFQPRAESCERFVEEVSTVAANICQTNVEKASVDLCRECEVASGRCW